MKDTWQLQVDLFCWKMCKFYVDRYFARRPLLVVWRCFQHLSLPLRFFKIPSSPFFIQITSRGMKSNECVSYLNIVAVYSSLIDWTLLEWGSYKKTKLSLASWYGLSGCWFQPQDLLQTPAGAVNGKNSGWRNHFLIQITSHHNNPIIINFSPFLHWMLTSFTTFLWPSGLSCATLFR